jgi:deoxyhypusine monooxygenase
VQDRLLDLKQPLAKRMRVVCSLRAVRGHGTIEALAACLKDDSALLRHEVAYALGQKEELAAVPILIDTLRNDKDAMVRHEAAEALGAIGAPQAIAVLEEFEHSDVEEVAHTCQLALDRIRWNAKKCSVESKFGTSRHQLCTFALNLP